MQEKSLLQLEDMFMKNELDRIEAQSMVHNSFCHLFADHFTDKKVFGQDDLTVCHRSPTNSNQVDLTRIHFCQSLSIQYF